MEGDKEKSTSISSCISTNTTHSQSHHKLLDSDKHGKIPLNSSERNDIVYKEKKEIAKKGFCSRLDYVTNITIF
jgi:hypothetical protein